MVWPSALSQPSAIPRTRRPRMTRLKSMPYSTSFVLGVTMPLNFTSPVASAMP
jgi:hypothetical protein